MIKRFGSEAALYFSGDKKMMPACDYETEDALVIFNRFYQPDFNINKLILTTDLHYSESAEIKLPLLWIALLYGIVNLSLAATTGVQSAVEVIKYLLAGADVVITAPSLYKNGIPYLKIMNKELQDWMNMIGFDTINTFMGSVLGLVKKLFGQGRSYSSIVRKILC